MDWHQRKSQEERDILIGQRFGMLTVLSEAEPATDKIGRPIPRLRCICDCGNETIALQNMIENGHTISCGCTRSRGKNRKDLTGRKFRKLTVISEADPAFDKYGHSLRQWKCVCECGNHLVVRQSNLEKPKGTGSCGCLRGKRIQPPPNLTGNRYGFLTVLSPAGPKLHTSGLFRRVWTCRCDCGNEVVVDEDKLLCGQTRSCGCLRGSGLKGHRFGMLTAISKADARHWRCKCECGNEITVSQDDLFWGTRTDCGCQRRGKTLLDLTGRQFGKLTALREVSPIITKRGKSLRAWLCRCSCGREVVVRQGNLTGKVTRSCGCLKKEKARKRATSTANQ